MILSAARRQFGECDVALMRALGSPRQAIPAFVFVFVALPLFMRWPAGQAYFGFDLVRGLLLYAPFALLSVVGWIELQRHGASFRWYGLNVVGSLYFQFVLASWVLLVSARAAPIMTAMLVVAMLVHGFVLCYSVEAAFLPLGSLLAVLVALPMAPDLEHAAALAFGGGTGVVAAMLVGTAARRGVRMRRQNTQLKHALWAEELARKQQELRDVSEVALELFGNVHDIRNALTSAKLQAQCVAEMMHDEMIDRDELGHIAADLLEAVQRVEETIEQVRRVAKERGAELARADAALPNEALQFVALQPILAQLRGDLSARYRDREIGLWVPEDVAAVKVRCIGGDTTLRRVFENLMLNAIQGDGRRVAGKIDVSMARAPGEAVEVRVSDDGPGFPPEILRRRIRGVHTTKPDGTGLGLLTSERLITACGGALKLGNRQSGGAEVIVRLLCEESARTAEAELNA